MSASTTSQAAEAVKALFPSAAAYSNDILIRGDQAARATPIDLVKTQSAQSIQEPQPVGPVGPWADELQETREQARMAGFAQGREEGHNLGLKEGQSQAEREVAMIRAEAEAQVAALREVVQSTMESLTASFGEQVARISEEASSSTVELALEIAEAVLGHQVTAADDPGAAAIARCLELAPATGELNAHLNPEDLMILGDIPGLEGRKLTLTPDSSLQRGDAIVTVNEATIDARLSESLRRVAEALR